jgi:hypothetical protein
MTTSGPPQSRVTRKKNLFLVQMKGLSAGAGRVAARGGYSQGAMATQAQIDANRQNSQRSTGPRSIEGKAVSRFNALKSGIDAKAQVIPGEEAAELEALAADYHRQYRPENPLEVFLVDSLVNADWQLRRLKKVEQQLWVRAMQEGANLGEAFTKSPVLERLYRRQDAAERSMYRALKELQRIRKGKKQDGEADVAEGPGTPAEGELGSFPQAPNRRRETMGPADGIVEEERMPPKAGG